MDRIKDITAKLVETQDWPEFGAGDTVTVTIKIKEGNKERLQSFQGVVIQRRGSGATGNLHRSQDGQRRGCGAHLPHLFSVHRED